MTFLDQIFASLEHSGDAVVLQELRDGQEVPLTARQVLAQVLVARAYLRRLRLKKGDRCALLAHNSMQWVAMDLAAMAEGITVVPLYARQAPTELVAMMKDCSPARLLCATSELRDSIVAAWSAAPPVSLFDEIFAAAPQDGCTQGTDGAAKRIVYKPICEVDPTTIIYTSGTS